MYESKAVTPALFSGSNSAGGHKLGVARSALRSRSRQHASAISTEREISIPSRTAIPREKLTVCTALLRCIVNKAYCLIIGRFCARHIPACVLLSVKKRRYFRIYIRKYRLFFPCEPGFAVTHSYLRRPLDALYLRYTASAPTERVANQFLSSSSVPLCGRLSGFRRRFLCASSNGFGYGLRRAKGHWPSALPSCCRRVNWRGLCVGL